MPRIRLALCVTLATALSSLSPAQAQRTGSAKVDVLAKSTAWWNGKRYTGYPKTQPELTLLKMTIPANTLSVQAGLTPLQAVTLATRDAAEFLRLTDRGRIAPGLRADLLVVRGDPSRDIAAADQVLETWANGTAVAGPLAASQPL